MCQMLNIWHISHTKPNLSPFIRCGILYIFSHIAQYRDKFATVRKRCCKIFIHCLFLSPSVSSLSPNPLLSSLSRPRPRPRPRPRRRPRRRSFPRRRRRRSLSSNGFSVFFFFFLLWFDGFGSDGGRWVRMG